MVYCVVLKTFLMYKLFLMLNHSYIDKLFTSYKSFIHRYKLFTHYKSFIYRYKLFTHYKLFIHRHKLFTDYK